MVYALTAHIVYTPIEVTSEQLKITHLYGLYYIDQRTAVDSDKKSFVSLKFITIIKAKKSNATAVRHPYGTKPYYYSSIFHLFQTLYTLLTM